MSTLQLVKSEIDGMYERELMWEYEQRKPYIKAATKIANEKQLYIEVKSILIQLYTAQWKAGQAYRNLRFIKQAVPHTNFGFDILRKYRRILSLRMLKCKALKKELKKYCV